MARKKKSPSRSFPIIGVGASAGGLEALTQLLKGLPPDPPFAMVVVQHLDPHHSSQSGHILARHTQVPVEVVEHGTEVACGRVYVIPPGVDLILERNTLKLSARANDGRPRSVDLFFMSLAKEKKAKAVGIVLSGSGSDGTAGLTAIKAGGGTTYAQDPTTANYDGMPVSAIKAGAVDHVLDPGAIAHRLGHKKKARGAAEETPDQTLQRICRLLQVHTHIDFANYKMSTVARRIQRRMRAHKFENLRQYLEYLEQNPGAVKEQFEEMFIHVTEFFRDDDSFAQLKKTLFPRLMKNRIAGVPVRIWVPGCSTGEEAYSIAISLMEFLGAKAASTPVQIFATDISEAAVKKARAGFYDNDRIEGLTPERLKNFFEKSKDGYRIKKTIRDLCIFSRHDVTSSPPFAKIDLLSCRNLLIYFSQELQKKVLPVFHYALNPDGFLWLGRSEAPTGFSKLFTLADKTHKIYTKIDLPMPLAFKFPSNRNFAESPSVSKRPADQFAVSRDSQREFDRIILSRYAPAGVMINKDLEIIQVRGHTGPFMELSPGQPSHNLFKLVRRELLPAVRMAIQGALAENEAVRKENLSYEFGGARKKADIEVVPVNPLAPPDERHYLILFEDRSGAKKAERPAAKGPAKTAGKKAAPAKEAYVRQLLDELDAMRDYQQSLAEGYEAGQEELTAANEELQSANEELQSTNEEMETAKEELQAANEELTTVNEELQGRNSELVNVNEQLAESEERFRLLVSGVKDYAIFLLDPQGRVATWNEGARRFKGYEAGEIIGKHFSIFYPQKARDEKYPDYELKVATKEGRYEDEGWRVRKDGSTFWANVVITRINDTNGRVLGFTKVTRDLTERKQAEERLKRMADELEIRVRRRTEELSAALNARDEFLSIASHELKTPLTSLKLHIQMERRRLGSPEDPVPTRDELIESYDMAIRQINSLADLVEDLLDTSRIQTGNFILQLNEVDLASVVRESVQRFAGQLKSAGCSVEMELDSSIKGFWDPQRVEQVIVNLISNAIKYAPGAPLRIATSLHKGRACLVVQDFGPGIPEDLRERIFERFERARAHKNVGGLGLGLFIVRKIVAAHNGKIHVEDEEGRGAKFIVDLPLNPQEEKSL